MTADRHIQVWERCLQVFQNIVEPSAYNSWFKPLKAVAMVDNTITVEVPSEFFREYLETYFLDVLVKVLKREIGADAKLVYRVRPVTAQPYIQFPASHTNPAPNKPIQLPRHTASANPGAFVIPGITRVNINPNLNSVYCFGNLVEGECNKLAVSAGRSIAMNPGKTAFNPLLLFGKPGLGKTHLAQAIGIAIKEQCPDLVVLYIPAHRLKTQYMEAVAVKNKLTDFLAFYMKMDVLIVDDIQELSSPGVQNAFFHIFNHLHQNGKQLVFTSDRAPADLKNFEERLLSRLKWGLSVELQAPDFATRLAMLRARCFREGVRIDDDVLVYIATNVKKNFRELEGTLMCLIAQATLIRKPVTIELAREVTGQIVSAESSELTIEKVMQSVCDYFNITKEILLSRTRKRQIVQARQIAMYLCRNRINCSLSTIGNEIGGKDHATVLHACSTVNDLIETDKLFRQYVSDIEKMLVSVN